MHPSTNGKHAISHLNSNWRHIIATTKPSHEIVYRLEKLMLRLDVVADKIFIKTVCARDILEECAQLTQRFQGELSRHRDAAFLRLTRLEGRVDELVKKTHEFRIKAG